MSNTLNKFGAFFLFSVAISTLSSTLAFAGTANVDFITDNIIESANEMPGLISALSYALGILLGVLGVLKVKEHVENPSQTPLRTGIIRLIVGGALFALPTIYEAAANTIGVQELDIGSLTVTNAISGIFGRVSDVIGVASNDFNQILSGMLRSIRNTPDIISAIAYLLGLVIGVQAILKTKDHVENPDQNPLKDVIIRFIVSGALLALPTIYNAMFTSIVGDGTNAGAIVTSASGAAHLVSSGYSAVDCAIGLASGVTGAVNNGINAINGAAGVLGINTGLNAIGTGPTAGTLICGIIGHTSAFPAFLTAISYVIGLVLGLWGIFKIRDHVLNPTQTQLWEGVTRLMTGGAFFALPIIIEVARVSLTGGSAGASALGRLLGLGGSVTGYNTDGCEGAGGGLDAALICFMGDVMGPIHIVLNFFAFVAGIILLMIGLSRLIKSSQDGARGPGGLGTIMTFVTGGALISYNEITRAFSTSLFGGGATKTFATIAYADGAVSDAEAAAAHSTITAILQFVIIVGLISFVRGIFIIRGVAEGNQQSSMMAAITHLIGGALAVNLGPLLNAIQSTLGIGAFGIAFG